MLAVVAVTSLVAQKADVSETSTTLKRLPVMLHVYQIFVCVSWQATNKRGKETFYTGAKFVLATGERPRYLGVPGDKEYCITRWQHRAEYTESDKLCYSVCEWLKLHPELLFRPVVGFMGVWNKCHLLRVWSLKTNLPFNDPAGCCASEQPSVCLLCECWCEIILRCLWRLCSCLGREAHLFHKILNQSCLNNVRNKPGLGRVYSGILFRSHSCCWTVSQIWYFCCQLLKLSYTSYSLRLKTDRISSNMGYGWIYLLWHEIFIYEIFVYLQIFEKRKWI